MEGIANYNIIRINLVIKKVQRFKIIYMEYLVLKLTAE